MKIIEFQDKHLTEATKLFIDAYKKQRKKHPILSSKYEESKNIMPLLENMLQNHFPSYVALEEEKVVGYMMGYPIPEFKGTQNGIFIPEWGHAGVYDRRLSIYQTLFSHLSTDYVKKDFYNYCIQNMTSDLEELDYWFWNGFGMLVVDGVRGLDDILVDNSDVTVKIATKEDTQEMLKLVHAHQKHYPTSPIFLPVFGLDIKEELDDLVDDAKANIWIAYHENEMVGYILACLNSDSELLRNDETLNVKGAYVKPEFRGQDIASLLLSHLIKWAKEKGFERVSVDFEATNLQARKFWLRHFEAVSYSVFRHIDDRMNKSIL